MKKALFQRALCLLLTLSTLLTGLGFTASAGSLKDADLEEGEESIYTTLEEMQALIGTSSYSEYIDDYVWELNNQTGLIAPTIDLIGGMYADVSSGVVVSQSELCDKLFPLLTENEMDIYKLGRNYKTSSKPRHSSAVEYHRASGFEAVFGYLHLSGCDARARELFDSVYKEEFDIFNKSED